MQFGDYGGRMCNYYFPMYNIAHVDIFASNSDELVEVL